MTLIDSSDYLVFTGGYAKILKATSPLEEVLAVPHKPQGA